MHGGAMNVEGEDNNITYTTITADQYGTLELIDTHWVKRCIQWHMAKINAHKSKWLEPLCLIVNAR